MIYDTAELYTYSIDLLSGMSVGTLYIQAICVLKTIFTRRSIVNTERGQTPLESDDAVLERYSALQIRNIRRTNGRIAR